MAEIQMVTCLLCKLSVPPGKRALLKGDMRHFVSSVISKLFGDRSSTEAFLDGRVLCRGKCQKTLMKYLHLKKQAESLKLEISSKIVQVYRESYSSPTWHPAARNPPGDPNTPLSSRQSCNSPDVSVSLLI